MFTRLASFKAPSAVTRCRVRSLWARDLASGTKFGSEDGAASFGQQDAESAAVNKNSQGLPPLPEEPLDFEERLAICGECKHAREFISGFASFCAECGCNIQAKAFFEHLHCPINKW